MHKIQTTILAILLAFAGVSIAQSPSRVLRFPTIHGNQIVFSYAGDLYTVARAGGIARKLTADNGYEMFPRFSPDGKSIAFTGQFDGNTEVYLIPAEGGVPKRLTYTATISRDEISDRMGPNNIVMGWTPDGKSIIYRSRKNSFVHFVGQLNLVSQEGGLSTELPLPRGGFCSYAPDNSKLAYNKVFREFRTWKYYRGGMADDIWIYDFKTKSTVNITNNPAQDIFPMWNGNDIYFLSDRDRTMNLFVYNQTTKETKKLTNFTEYDIKFPSLGDDAIVFENGGFIYTYDLSSAKAKKIDIQIADDQNNSRPKLVNASETIDGYSLSPDASRILFDARGDIYSVPFKTGVTRNLTATSGVHERNSAWSPDGKYIAYISDATGEDEIYLRKQDGSEAPVQLTDKADTYKFGFKWSPDSKKILWNDKKLRLSYLDIDTKKITLVTTAKVWEITDYNWAPDSKWITYAETEKNQENRIFIYSLTDAKINAVTEELYESHNPVFSNDGKYLFFASNRTFKPTYSWIEWNHSYTDMAKIYMVILNSKTPSPFALENNEFVVKSEEKPKADEKKETNLNLILDLSQITTRILEIPTENAAYTNLNAVKDGVIYLKKQSNKPQQMAYYDLKTKKETILGSFDSYRLSADGKKILLADKHKFSVCEFSASALSMTDMADLGGMKTIVNKKEEWMAIYNECWRQMRDFFYDPNMNGVNWKSIKDKYAPMAAGVNQREDLNYVIGEMIGELNSGHSYIGGGDIDKKERISIGLLGAQLSKDATGYFRIDKILKGQNWNAEKRSPLCAIGINAAEGELILAINGVPTNTVNDIYSMLIDKAGKQVELTINAKADLKSAHKEIVMPLAHEESLYYYNWVQENIRKVSEASNGEIGYLHIPDMMTEGLNEFAEYFYPQINKKALIIDDRFNAGGNISPMLIERLSREMVVTEMGRNTEPSSSPSDIHIGPKACLINEYSASDGDLFAYRFRKMKLGTLIGTRTWGGVIGIRGTLPIIDDGVLNKPEFAHYAADGSGWIIEGKGVEPDITVVNDPAKEYNGVDEQLNKAIEVIMTQLKTGTKEIPAIPAFPDKTK